MENGDATMTREANADEERMKLRLVEMARRVVALRLMKEDTIIIIMVVV